MYFQQSLYDQSKLNDYLGSYFDEIQIKRALNIGIANVLNGTQSSLFKQIRVLRDL